MSSVISTSIDRGGIDLAAHLHVPDGFDEMYDVPAYVDEAVDHVAAFFAAHLP